MMRTGKITLAVITLVGLVVLLVGCSSASDATNTSENQVVTVQRGGLTIDITAAGNLALSHTEDLAFEAAGTVEEVLVEEGDTVEEGQLLAKLDTSEWEDQIKTLKRDMLQAEINLKNAQVALEEAEAYYVWPAEIFAAREAVFNAESQVKEAQQMISGGVVEETYDRQTGTTIVTIVEAKTPWDIKVWTKNLEDAQDKLRAAQVKLDKLLAASAGDTEEVAIKRFEVDLSQIKLGDSQKALAEAENATTEVVAPFGGFITLVNVEGGDEVLKGTVAVQIADPNKFEADIMVSEMDIMQVKIGGEASVQVDAMSGLTLPAKVTRISPTATVQSGVVNYKVRVELQSLEEVMQERQQAMQAATANITQGELPERLRQAIEEGRITQEQIEEMMKQRQEGLGEQQGQVPTAIPEDFQLREGLTVTVSIIVEQKSDVLLVPNGAITTQGQQTYVKVQSPDGTIEERAITTGISNWQYTEVTEGLSEGEKVMVPQGTATTSTTQQQQPGGMFIPGTGGVR